MSHPRIDALLERLVAQFASPYDFLRELVQNAMDAGSDLVDVVLHTHGAGEDVVFELEVADAGDGMDEAIIDGELTRLFASSKAGDRTMAGGFGIGFVSVFAWEPEVVLLQTGRRSDAWELVFGADRTFEKHAVDELLEGTTLRMFRRGHISEREAVAEAIRDSLWRWCRFCPIDITFEDLEGGAGPEAIRDAPLPEDAVAHVEHVDGETTIRVAFASVPHVVLLRHGLVLAEGSAAEHLPHLSPQLGATAQHLRLWVDSPRLRTSLARDSVVDDAGRAGLEREVSTLLGGLREQLIARVERAAARWTSARHDAYAYAHAHLACERHVVGPTIVTRPVLRTIGGPVSVATLRQRARAGIVAVVAPEGPSDPSEGALRVAAVRGGVPLVVARWPHDAGWLEPLLALLHLQALPLHEAVSRVEPIEDGAALAGLVFAVLTQLELGMTAVRIGRHVDAPDPPLLGVGLPGGAVLHADPVPPALVRGAELFVDPRHRLVEEAEDLYRSHPSLSVLGLAEAVALRIGGDSQAEGVANAWAQMQ